MSVAVAHMPAHPDLTPVLTFSPERDPSVMRELSSLDLTPALVRGLGNFSGVLSLLGERPRGQVPQ